MRVKFAGLFALAGTSAMALDLPSFEARPLPSHVYNGGWEHFVGGGVAGFDCNGDGLMDVVLAGGENPAQLMVNASVAGEAIAFAKADFQTITGVTGAYPLDIDADGHLDLAVLRVGADLLLKGDGACGFAPFGPELGFGSGDHWTTAFSATWEEGNSLPTLAFGTYVDRSNPDGPFEACDVTLLYRPDGESYGKPTELAPGYCALSMLFTDWDRSGRQDLRVSNDRHYYVRGGQEQLWAMSETPRLYGEADGWADYQLWGMGIASRDMNGDGYSDVYLTSMGDQKFQYFDADGEGPAYANAPYEIGISAHRPYTGGDGRPSTGWHAAFVDVQNDGLDDIFVAKGNVDQMPVAAMDDPNNLLIQNPNGTFEEVGEVAGVSSVHRSRGGLLADLNNDGRLDLLVVNRRVDAELFENITDAGNWLAASLDVKGVNRAGVGYFIEVDTGDRVQVREVTIGGGHAGGSLGAQHFGLGGLKGAKLRLIRPDQSVSAWIDVSTNQSIVVTDDGVKVSLR
ncbi:FG-GAP repeat domain-containing protein [Cognatishimia activa]|uniref:FG-GAP repeat domain-containing protein n=1 Tax=Cognatishimia activa TaxID=1715691 RepID=UPI0006F18AC5|nr:VCBS repeat-containing protein [Cognatishimia activa]CUI86792.1 ASPIC and UnbV [Cognatishimia activa]